MSARPRDVRGFLEAWRQIPVLLLMGLFASACERASEPPLSPSYSIEEDSVPASPFEIQSHPIVADSIPVHAGEVLRVEVTSFETTRCEDISIAGAIRSQKIFEDVGNCVGGSGVGRVKIVGPAREDGYVRIFISTTNVALTRVSGTEPNYTVETDDGIFLPPDFNDIVMSVTTFMCNTIFDAPTGDPVLDDPATQTALFNIILESGAFDDFAPTSSRLEHAGYVYEDPQGNLEGRLNPPNPANTPCDAIPGPPNPQGDIARAVYHSHPFKDQDVLPANCGRAPGAKYDAFGLGGGSKDDWEFIAGFGISIYVIDKTHVARLDDGVSQANWPANPNVWAWNPAICGLVPCMKPTELIMILKKPFVLLALMSGFALATTGSVVAQGGSKCLPEGGFENALFTYAQLLATSTEPRFDTVRTNYGILPVPASEVELISDKATCRDASQAYKNVLGATGSSPDVWVIRIGSRFMVTDPGETMGDKVVSMIFDDTFNHLATFAS